MFQRLAGERSASFGLPSPSAHLQAVIVIPARDEAARIADCLRALADQQSLPRDSYEVIVVLDGCRDGTLEVIDRSRGAYEQSALHTVVLAQPRGVGHARRLGMDIACERLTAITRHEGLIATTDADTIVAPDWLSAQLELARAGVQAIGGLIELDSADPERLDPSALAIRDRSLAQRLGSVEGQETGAVDHPHFAGASLSLTVSAYLRCGGLPVRAALEDEALAQALHRQGIAIHRSREVRVRTSTRSERRAPRGLAHDLARAHWRARRTFKATDYPLERLLGTKEQTVALLLPAREVAQTIAPIARCAAALRDVGLLDEVLVIDAASKDGTAAIARGAGVEVAQESELLSECGPALGKGDAMWRGLAATSSEIVVFVDTDTEDFQEHFILGLLGPLICDPEIELVKGAFRRPFRSGGMLVANGGGRVTELMARPLLNLHAPELTVFEQPLAGEVAARRILLEEIPFSAGYGVEIAMLLDCWQARGLDALAQVDLGQRQNRHQSLRDLSAMAYAVLVAAQARFLGEEFTDAHACASVILPPDGGLSELMEVRPVTVEERLPLAAHRKRATVAA